jgi:hypothetical protein
MVFPFPAKYTDPKYPSVRGKVCCDTKDIRSLWSVRLSVHCTSFVISSADILHPHSWVAEDSSLLRCDAASLCVWFLTFTFVRPLASGWSSKTAWVSSRHRNNPNYSANHGCPCCKHTPCLYSKNLITMEVRKGPQFKFVTVFIFCYSFCRFQSFF